MLQKNNYVLQSASYFSQKKVTSIALESGHQFCESSARNSKLSTNLMKSSPGLRETESTESKTNQQRTFNPTE